MTIGEIKGSNPKKQHIRTTGEFFDALDVKDIPGTTVGSRTKGNFHSKERTHFTDTNNTAEIEGAQVNTLKKGLVSKRATNPLNPVYSVPGHSEMTI